MKYIYQISFNVRHRRRNRLYSGEFDFPEPITTFEQIVNRLIADGGIKKEHIYPLNFQLLRTEE